MLDGVKDKSDTYQCNSLSPRLKHIPQTYKLNVVEHSKLYHQIWWKVGEVGGNTLRETQCHIYDTPVNSSELNGCEIREVTCGYRSEHELQTYVTRK